jgi:hypothetical protein
MNAAFVSHERDREQDEYHDKHNTLFVLREFENGEQTLHSVSLKLWHSLYGTRSDACIDTVPVMLGEAKHLWLLRCGAGLEDQRFFSRDCGIRMTRKVALHFFA